MKKKICILLIFTICTLITGCFGGGGGGGSSGAAPNPAPAPVAATWDNATWDNANWEP